MGVGGWGGLCRCMCEEGVEGVRGGGEGCGIGGVYCGGGGGE